MLREKTTMIMTMMITKDDLKLKEKEVGSRYQMRCC